MFDLIEFRELLGDEAEGLTDAEVLRIRDIQYGFFSAAFDVWLRKRNAPSTVMVPNTS